MSAGARLLGAAVAIALLAALAVWLRNGEDVAPASQAASRAHASGTPTLVEPREERRAAAEEPPAAVEPEPVAPAPEDPPPPAGQAELSGWLLVDGAPPPQAIELTLVHAADAPGAPGKQVQRTAPDGGFRFEGLAVTWSGALRLPPGWCAEAPGEAARARTWWAFDAPAAGLTLEVLAVRSLRGRVVDCPSGAPVPSAVVDVFLHEEGLGGTSAPVRCDQEGRFVLPVFAYEFRRLTLTAQLPDGGRARATVLERAQVPDSLDVGDLCLAEPRALAFRVVDAAGAPVPHAVGRALKTRVRARADARGEGVLRDLPPGELELRFAAEGFHAAGLTALAGQQELLVQLARGNRLVVQLAGAGFAQHQMLIELHSLEPLLLDTGGWDRDRVLREVTGSELHMTSRGPGDAARIFADRDGRLELESVASVPIRLVVLDALREPLHERELAPMGPQEQREVRVELPADLGAVRGRVLDGAGAPLDAVRVHAFAPEARHSGSTSTDAEGRFDLGPIARERVSVQLERAGFATALLRDVPTRGPELELRMEAGRELDVEVRDPSGAPVEAEQVTAVPLGADAPRWRGSRSSPGDFRLTGVASGLLLVRAVVGGRSYEREHDPRAGPLHIEVPRHGALELTWTLPAGADARSVSVRSPEDPGLELDWRTSFLPDTRLEIPALLPGRYVVQLHGRKPADGADVPLSRPLEVEIEAGRTTRAELLP